MRPGMADRIICQSIGTPASGQPYGGFRYAAGRDLGKIHWLMVYDLICRLWPEFELADVIDEYRQGVNRILSGYGVVWELSEKGHLKRHLPSPAQSLVDTAITQLTTPRFAPALALMNAHKMHLMTIRGVIGTHVRTFSILWNLYLRKSLMHQRPHLVLY